MLITVSGCVGIVLFLLLTLILTTRLLSNREMVNSFIVAKADQAIGAQLTYDRLEVRFLPLPHLNVSGVHLRRPNGLTVDARELSLYLRMLPILSGRVSIRRLILAAPDIHIPLDPDAGRRPTAAAVNGMRVLQDPLKEFLGGFFGALTSIDPGAELQVKKGTLSMAAAGEPDLRISAINAVAENKNGRLSLNLHGRSDDIGTVALSAHADAATLTASGQLTLAELNLRPLLNLASLPGGVATGDTRASARMDFSVDGFKKMQSRFSLQVPALEILRNDRTLHLKTVAVSGTFTYENGSVVLSVDSLDTQQPPLSLSASVTFSPAGPSGKADLQVHAATDELDVDMAGRVTRAIAGDLKSIQTAFDVARDGYLTHATYSAGFDVDGAGWRLKTMKASGRLSDGRVTLPGIDADLEEMDGQVDYADTRVAFKKVSGAFKGVRFNNMEAVIDWKRAPTLAISGRSATVDAAPLYAWLTSFEGLNNVETVVSSVAGSLAVSMLDIHGPLTDPARWTIDISGTPEKVRLKSPLVPFDVTLTGGQLTYKPGQERFMDVTVTFLDGSFISSYQASSDVNPGSAIARIDGSMGPETVRWLSTVLPVPEHLQLKPPIEISDASVQWDKARAFAFTGGIKTAGGVDLHADVAIDQEAWQIRNLHFSDGWSTATVSAQPSDSKIELAFTGNIERQTADRLLRDNKSLLGRIEGDFQTLIDPNEPLNTRFTGTMAGEGLHLRSLFSEPVELTHFSLDGSGSRLKVTSSEAILGSSRLTVSGEIDRSDGGLTFDLDVDADHLDEALIRALGPSGKKGEEVEATPSIAPEKTLRGTVRLDAARLTYDGLTWRPVQADIHTDGKRTRIQVHQATLCGISTTGNLEFSPQGVSLRIVPAATGTAFQETIACLWNKQVKADARYDLSGQINLPPTREASVRLINGGMEFSSTEGRIDFAPLLMKIFSVLNITEIFTGGQSDLTEKGLGYTRAYAKAEIGGGNVQLSEILLDGHALKLTGQGRIALDTLEADITLLAAPLKTVDRIINKVPIINYIAGGSLISIPLRIRGPLTDLTVTPMSPEDVGKGILNLMGRTLKAPFKLVQSAAELAPDTSSEISPPKSDSTQTGP
ncbi:MAG: AsmA-like C-terminal domain-containing protein [Desulfosarcina sp.]